VRRAIATVSLSGTLEEKLDAAARAGFDGIELFEPDLIGSHLSHAELRRYCQDLGLEIMLYQPFRDLEAVSDATWQRNLRRAHLKFDIMEKLGSDLMLLCSNVSDSAIDDDALAAAQLRKLAEQATERGIRLAYEALAWGRHVRDYDHAWAIVAAADHPQLGICLDSFHILSRGADPGGIRDIPAEKIFFVQLADAPRMALDVLQWSRHYRCFPGQGGFAIGDFVEQVLATGYDGPLSLEVFNDVFRRSDPQRTAIDAMRSLLLLEDGLGPSRARDHRRLSPPADLRGYAFVELSVDLRASVATERLLRAMGFALVGEHRSKPVELWEQGGIRIVLSRVAEVDGSPQTAAIAVESVDPSGSATRARELLAPPVPLRHAPGEADISAVAAPDGTAIFFCRTRPDDETSWFSDFEPVARVEPQESAGLTRIDHVALTQPLDYFDEAALFYRSVLGLQPRDREELASPDGLVRSRALADSRAQVRIVLNAPALGGGALGGTPGAQHVAFACDDALLAARALREAGVPLLHISDNYFDDLSARLDLDVNLLEQMRALGVLYDRSERGEFLHFYVETQGARVFFEVVERRGEYDAYGAVNSPVRMAAQRTSLETRRASVETQRASPAALGGASL
jgi:4-hydroxyphenylpyruvate dioxygenase